MRTHQKRSGFSLVEVMIMMAVLAFIMTAVWMVVSTVIKQDESLRRRVDLQMQCSKALKEMASLLKQSGACTGDASAPLYAAGTYPFVFPMGGLLPASYAYAADFGVSTGGFVKNSNVRFQTPNVTLEEGLGPSNGILFRIAKDSDNPDERRGMAVNKGSNVGSYDIQWGNEFHAFTLVEVVYPDERVNELHHRIWTNQGVPKSDKVLATNVERIFFETSTSPAPIPTPPWPLPSLRARETGEDAGLYQNAIKTGVWPAGPSTPFELRITLCLAQRDLRNQTQSVTNSAKMTTVWQQIVINMRSIAR